MALAADVAGGGADGFVRNVRAIHLNARRAAKAPAHRDGLIADLGRVEVGSILNLHARLKLRQIKEVAPVDRQILDLGRGQNALHRRLFRVDAGRSGLNLDGRALRAYLQLEIDRAVVANLNHHLSFGRGKSLAPPPPCSCPG